MYREELGAALIPAQLAALVALIPQVDLAPGPGGSRITPLNGLQDDALAILGPPVARHASRAALIALYPSSQLVAHCDPPLSGVRLHIPLVTNPGCWSFSAGHWQQLTAGVVYQMNPAIEHGAVNWGPTLRVHLMVDLRG